MSAAKLKDVSATVTLQADRIEPGALVFKPEGLVQETRLWLHGQVVCLLRVTYPPGSPEWTRARQLRALDGAGREAA